MGSKRAAAAADDDDGHRPATEKRQRQGGGAAASKRSAQAPDLTYGQRAAFGDLADSTAPADDDLQWEDETDALAYLRSVRHEARGIPNVLAAARADRDLYDDGRGDFRGYYHDGAYVALPEGQQHAAAADEQGEGEYEGGYEGWGEEGQDEDEDDDDDYESSEATTPGRPRNSNTAEIQDAYFAALMTQYEALRRVLNTAPPADVVAALPHESPVEVGGVGGPSSATFRQWAGRLRNTDPRPAQVAAMHKDGVVRLVRVLLGGGFLRGGALRERTSRWLWALLARLPDRGELDYQEVGWVRELGKSAVLAMVSLAEAEILQRQYGAGDAGGEDAGEADDDEGADDDDNDDDEAAGPGSQAGHGVQHGPKWPQEKVDSQNDHHAHRDPDATGDDDDDDDDDAAASPPDVEMPDDSDMEAEEGEVSADPPIQKEPPADLETAKLRLLAQLSGAGDPVPPDNAAEEEAAAAAAEAAEAEERGRTNARATLNMILTVAGEFYGQRDLLEFRDPFGRVLEDGG